MWPKSSSVSTINLAKKIYYSTRDIEFFLGVTFLPVTAVSIERSYAWLSWQQFTWLRHVFVCFNEV